MVIDSIRADIAHQHIENIVEADDLLREIVQAGRRPNFAEMTFFQRECGWDDRRVTGEMRRMTNVLRLQTIAGTTEDRAAAGAEFESANAIAGKECPKLQAKIEELQTKLAALQRDERLSQKLCEEQHAACEQLKALVPEHIAAAVNDEIRILKSSLGKEISNAKVRANELECCLDPQRYPNEAAWLETLQRSFRDAVFVGDTGGFIKRALSSAWPTIRLQLENELVELNAKLNDMRADYDAAMTVATARQDYYAR